METSDVIGFCAMCMSAVRNIPQLHKINSDDDVTSFTKEAVIIGIIVSFMWLYYGIVKKANVMIIGSIFSILYELYIIHKILKSEKDK